MFKLEGDGSLIIGYMFLQVGVGVGERVISGSLQYTTTPLRPCGWLGTFFCSGYLENFNQE